METKVTDPVQRVRLHAARTLILGTNSLMTFAEIDAKAGKALKAANKIRKAHDLLYEAELDIIDLLAVK